MSRRNWEIFMGPRGGCEQVCKLVSNPHSCLLSQLGKVYLWLNRSPGYLIRHTVLAYTYLRMTTFIVFLLSRLCLMTSCLDTRNTQVQGKSSAVVFSIFGISFQKTRVKIAATWHTTPRRGSSKLSSTGTIRSVNPNWKRCLVSDYSSWSVVHTTVLPDELLES